MSVTPIPDSASTTISPNGAGGETVKFYGLDGTAPPLLGLTCQSALNSFQVTGVRPCGWTELSRRFDRLPGVLIFELRGTEIAQGRV